MKKLLFMLIITTVGMGFLGCEKELIEPPENPDEFVDYAFQVEGAYHRIEIWDAVLGDNPPLKFGGYPSTNDNETYRYEFKDFEPPKSRISISGYHNYDSNGKPIDNGLYIVFKVFKEGELIHRDSIRYFKGKQPLNRISIKYPK